jgi:hypothetical protein
MPARVKPSDAKRARRSSVDSAPVMHFVDFSIRAWREGSFALVLAHATPAGAMRQPVAARLGVFSADDYRVPPYASLREAAEVGRALARMVLPNEVWRLLGQSLGIIAAHRNLGLRLRLCLDDDLIDLPWEFLYRPDVEERAAQSGFLLTDGRISLTREPPSVVSLHPSTDRTQRAVFVGTPWDDGSDGWAVKSEYASLTRAMRPVGKLLEFDYVDANDEQAVTRALGGRCDVFHYAGHTDIEGGRGRLVTCASAASLRTFDEQLARVTTDAIASSPPMQSGGRAPEWSHSEALGRRLAAAGTRLAVFNACNSGLWPFVQPLIHAGLPAVVGVQGIVTNLAALNFAEKFYQSLAVGLSLDEALTYARLYLLQPGRSHDPTDWGRFMAYLPSESSVLFPRPDVARLQQRQEQVRTQRAETLAAASAITTALDGEAVSRVLSEVASRSVLILGRFSADRKPILDLIRRELGTAPRQYVPILFDFERPRDRTLVESVLRFAAVSRFVVADLSDPKWVLAELQQIVPSFPSLPVVPILAADQHDTFVAGHLESYRSVAPVVRYRDGTHLRAILDDDILSRAETMYATLTPRSVTI